MDHSSSNDYLDIEHGIQEHGDHSSHGSDDHSSVKSNVEVRLLIENNLVGGIIGRQGANIKQVRDESACYVSILKGDTQRQIQVLERILLLKGSIQQVAVAAKLIASLIIQSSAERLRILKERKKAAAANNSEQSTNDSSSSSANNNEQKEKEAVNNATLKILVHKTFVGAIIGKGGSTIKETQQATNTRIQISNEALPNSSEKSVAVTGGPDEMYASFIRILNQLRDNPVSLKAGQKIIHYTPISSGHAMYHYGGASAASYNGYSNYSSMNNHSNNSSANNNPSQVSTQKIAIPTACAGAVIGKGGSVIRDVRSQSGTNISIADPDPNSPQERVVTLIGTPPSIQHAIYLIRQLVEQCTPPISYQ